jgi:precorrin isomerase
MLVIRLANGNTYPADRCTYRVDEATNKITHFDPNAVTVAVGNAPTAVGSTGARLGYIKAGRFAPYTQTP